MSNVTEAIRSNLRPFGDLPLSVPGDGKYAVFGVVAGVGALVLAHWIFMVIAMVRKNKEISERSQKNNFLLIIFSQVTLLCGLVSIAAATRQYPNEQPLWGQALGYVCFMGQALLFLPALFLKPLFQGKITAFKFPAEKAIMAVTAGFAAAALGLEIGVIVKAADDVTSVPVGLLYAIFAFQLAIVLTMLGLGLFSILETIKGTKTEKKSDNERVAYSENGSFNIPPKTGIRIAYLVAGILGVAMFVVFNAFESPQSLLMRGMEIAALFIILVVQFFFTWSLVKTVAQISLNIGSKADSSAPNDHTVLTLI
jgi:hypothetical protein